MSDSLPGSLPSSSVRPVSLHELSDSDGSEPVASTSAVRMRDSDEAATSGLRERVRAPYSATVPPRREALSKDVAEPPISANSKGKQREEPAAAGAGANEAKEADKGQNDYESSPFSCHICLETPSSDDCVVTKCGHLFCCELTHSGILMLC